VSEAFGLELVDALRALLCERVGYELPPEFHAFVARQANGLCEHLRLAPTKLVEQLQREAVSSSLWSQFISRMTIGESYFFRNPAHMKILRQLLLPELLSASLRRPVYIWSAGCARGEEPYTLAILLHELEPRVAERPIRIIGTDIDVDAIETARRCSYGEWAFRQTPFFVQRKYFVRQEKRLILRAAVAAMVDFYHHHIATDHDLPVFPPDGFDLILCRNVLMYLRQDYRHKAGRAFARRLRDSGALLTGEVERIDGADELFSRGLFEGTVIYRRADATARHALLEPTPSESLRLATASLARKSGEAERSPRPVPQEPPLLEQSPELDAELPETGFAELQSLMAARQIERARSVCESMLQKEPLNASAHTMLALIHVELEETDAATQALRRAIYCDPDHLASYYVWWLLSIRDKASQGERIQWARRHMARLVALLADEERIEPLARVTAGDVRYLLQRRWDSFP
jgi:chemotaxis protein methyltransferase CheR